MKQKEVIKPEWVPEAYRELGTAKRAASQLLSTGNSSVRPLTRRPLGKLKP